MDTVVIIADGDIPLDTVRSRLAPHWTLLGTPPDKLAIQEGNSRVYIYHAKLKSGGPDLKKLFLDYSWVDLVKRVVLLIGDDPSLLIDNDHGTVLPGDQFVALLRANPLWNWRP